MIFFRASAAFSLGLERTGGFETVAFCEIEPFPRKVLAKHWPGVPIYDDVRGLTKDVLDRAGIEVEVISGGFPCQDISTAGMGAGIEGARSGLWKEYARLIGEIRPRYVLIENVAALLGRGLATVLSDLAAIRYDAEWACLPASALGAVHQRDRIWLVAYPTGEGRPGLLRDIASISVEPPAGWAAIALDTSCAFDIRAGRQQRVGEPPFFGSNDGLPSRVDRLKSVGNAVLPQYPELIGNAILQWGGDIRKEQAA